MELSVLQTAADTNALNSDIEIQCKGQGQTVSSTWPSGTAALDITNVGGSNKMDYVTSASLKTYGGPGQTCFWRLSIDAGGTTTAMATLHILGMKMEFRKLIGD